MTVTNGPDYEARLLSVHNATVRFRNENAQRRKPVPQHVQMKLFGALLRGRLKRGQK